MTVTKEKKRYSFPTILTPLDTESTRVDSALASDTESLHNEPRRTVRPFAAPVFKNATYEDLITLKKCAGKKKLRRYQNRHSLQTLSEEEDEGMLVVIMEPYKSPFSKLLEDEEALHFWYIFIDTPEEEQAKILDAFSQKDTQETLVPVKEKPRISSKIKRTIRDKRDLPLERVKKTEDDLITFFQATPREIYIQHPPTYFERLLLHAIAQYHGLHSLAINENGVRRIEVFNGLQKFAPAECFLTDFVAQLRSQS